MKQLILLGWLLITQSIVFAQHEGHNMPAKQQPAKTEVYTCPMHPEVQRDKPGKCPKCGMNLEKKKVKVAAKSVRGKAPLKPAGKKSAPVHDMNDIHDDGNVESKKGIKTEEHTTVIQSATYTCPMHPEIHADKPGNCPKCGMKLIAEKSKPSAAEAATYTCPMHPEIHSSKPGNCPKCGMRLVEEKPKVSADNKMDMDMSKDKAGNQHNMNGMQMPARPQGGGTVRMPSDMGYKFIESKLPPRTVRYDLYIRDTIVNFGRKPKRAIAVNGQIPMPTLTFTEGDTAEIYVHNELKEETSLHWHGLFLPNRMDGVPFLTQMPIKPGSTYLYKFPIVQHGTHWYHSHSGLQEQIGMYGSFIMNKRREWSIPTIPVVLSEWIDMKPKEVHRSLHAATDWFAIQKGATQSYSEAIKSGHLKTKFTNEWKRMNAMDVSDVFYDNFLINGKNSIEYSSPLSFGEGSGVRSFKAGDKVRLRIANGGASDYFWLKYAGGKITVVASDGNDVVPVEVDRLIIAVSETYDVVVTIPENKSYEFLVTPEDRTKSASLWLGKGEKVPAGKMGRLKYFAGMKMMNEMMDMKGNMMEMEGMKMQNQIMDMNTVMYPEITGEEKPGNEMSMPARPSGGDDMNSMRMDNDSMKGQDMKSMKHDKTENVKGMDMSKPKMDNMKGHDTHNMQMAPSPSEREGGEAMSGMNMEAESSDIVTLNYNMLKAPEKTTLPNGPWRDLKFDLTGNMNRYVWSLDNKVISETDKILIKKGEKLRIVLFNNSMMRHPMHLHGHDFRVLNGQGEYAPMKNIIDIMPMERDTIEFYAGEAGGDWFFHCHILYHMMSGMGRVFSYDNPLVDKTDITDPKVAKRGLNSDDKRFHPMGRIGVESNGSDGEFMLAQTRWKASTLWHLGYHDMHGYESETTIGRYLGRMQWWFPYIGFDYHYQKEGTYQKDFFDLGGSVKNIFGHDEKNWFGQKSNKNNRKTITAGIAYTLPTLTMADFRVDGDGKFRFQLSREDIPLTPRLRFMWMLNTDKEYAAGFRYIVTKYFNLSTHYDSDMGIGAGVTITY